MMQTKFLPHVIKPLLNDYWIYARNIRTLAPCIDLAAFDPYVKLRSKYFPALTSQSFDNRMLYFVHRGDITNVLRPQVTGLILFIVFVYALIYFYFIRVSGSNIFYVV